MPDGTFHTPLAGACGGWGFARTELSTTKDLQTARGFPVRDLHFHGCVALGPGVPLARAPAPLLWRQLVGVWLVPAWNS